jgi:exopolysaccharide biosynthesis polyprenyl glycosylphosphotransferase
VCNSYAVRNSAVVAEPDELTARHDVAKRRRGSVTTDRTELVDSADQSAALAPVLGARRDLRRRRLKVGLILWDALVPAALLSFVALFSGSFGGQINGGPAHSTDLLALLLAVTAPIGLGLAGGYNHRGRRSSSRLLFALRLLLVGVCLSWVAIIVSAAADWPVNFSQMLAVAVLMPVGWLLGRAACDRHPAIAADRTLLVGSGFVADRVARLTARHPERRMVVVGGVSEADAPESGDGVPRLGSLDDLPDVLDRHRIDRVVVGFTHEPDAVMLDRLRACVAQGVEVDIVPRFFDLVGPTPRTQQLGGMALLEVPGLGLNLSQRAVKRATDIVGAGIALLLFAPIMGLVAAGVALSTGRPILFRQTRVGQYGEAFSILKFRTMRNDADDDGVARLAADADLGDADLGDAGVASVVRALKAASSSRVTRFGAVLRRTSLDELPQLWNVLRGDMSLVGPRPLRPFEAAGLADWQLARQELRPGLTGLWQVLGRSTIEWDERMQLDYTYVSHWSLVSDVRILARTLPAVLSKDGAL